MIKSYVVYVNESVGSFLKHIVGFPLSAADVKQMDDFQPPVDTYPNDCAPISKTTVITKFLNHRSLNKEEQSLLDGLDMDEFVLVPPALDNPTQQPESTTSAFVRVSNGIARESDMKRLKNIVSFNAFGM